MPSVLGWQALKIRCQIIFVRGSTAEPGGITSSPIESLALLPESVEPKARGKLPSGLRFCGLRVSEVICVPVSLVPVIAVSSDPTSSALGNCPSSLLADMECCIRNSHVLRLEVNEGCANLLNPQFTVFAKPTGPSVPDIDLLLFSGASFLPGDNLEKFIVAMQYLFW